MSYYRNRPFFGPGFGLHSGPPRTPKSSPGKSAGPSPGPGRRVVPGVGGGSEPGRYGNRTGEPSPARPARDIKVEDLASARKTSPTETMEAEIARLQTLVADKEREAREAAARSHGALDELERAKQRIRKDARKDAEQRTRSFLLSFIEVLDDLDRAIAAAREGNDDSAVLQGVELVRKRFVGKLASHQVVQQPALGARFDPALHEAVGMVPVDRAERDGVIVGVVREGYSIGSDTLRPAAVAVGRFHEPERDVEPDARDDAPEPSEQIFH